MGIYSRECELCKDETKKKKIIKKGKTETKTDQYMYECSNSKCKIQRTIKKELSKYYQMNPYADKKKRKS